MKTKQHEPYIKLTPAPWMRERAGLLHRLCECIDRRVGKGMLIQDAIRQVLARCAIPEYYRSEPNRRVAMSFGSMQRQYVQWRRSPHKETFLPGYKSPAPRLNDTALAALFERVLAADDLAQAIKALEQDWRAGFAIPGLPRRGPGAGKPPGSAMTWRRALGPELTAKLEIYFTHRRRVYRELLKLRTGKLALTSTKKRNR